MDSKELKNITASGTAWNTGPGINTGFLNAGGLAKGIMNLPLIVDGKIQTDEKGNALKSEVKCFYAVWKHKTKAGWMTIQFGRQAEDKAEDKKPEDKPQTSIATVESNVDESIPIE